MKAIVILNALSAILPKIAIIDLPDLSDESIKDKIWNLLNDCNNPLPSSFPSMSNGDFIIFPEMKKAFRCSSFGWDELSTANLQLERYI